MKRTGTEAHEAWGSACLEGCAAVSELGGAQVGDRTMLDALVPFSFTLHDQLARGNPIVEALTTAVQAARRGADSTIEMLPKRGRSAYLGDRVLGHADPGAVAVTVWLAAVTRALSDA